MSFVREWRPPAVFRLRKVSFFSTKRKKAGSKALQIPATRRGQIRKQVSHEPQRASHVYRTTLTYIDGHAVPVVVGIQGRRRRRRRGRHSKGGVGSGRGEGRRWRQGRRGKVGQPPPDRAGVFLDPGAAGLEEGAPRAVRVVRVCRRGLDPVRGGVGPVLERPGGVVRAALAEAPLPGPGRTGGDGGPLREAGLHRLQERAPRPVSLGPSSLRTRVFVSHGFFFHSTALWCGTIAWEACVEGVLWVRMSLEKSALSSFCFGA